jgi:large subunit ribosomal protein L5
MFNSLSETYEKKIIPKRDQLFGVKNTMATPRIEKVVVSARIKKEGEAREETVLASLAKITGQKPSVAAARQSISNFKIREGMIIGSKVTLRGRRAIDFLNKIIHVTLPRVRDFSGLSPKSFDGHGNYTIGLNEHNVFPEAADSDVAHLHGLEITVVTTADNDKDGFTLLTSLGFPFKK